MESMDMLDWDTGSGTIGNYGMGAGSTPGSIGGAPGGESMMVDEDYMELMTDTLFSTISSNQPIYFPDPREIGNFSINRYGQHASRDFRTHARKLYVEKPSVFFRRECVSPTSRATARM